MNYSIYQVTLETAEKNDLPLFAREYNPRHLRHYTHVADSSATDLDDLFLKPWTTPADVSFQPHRSLSCGDLILDEEGQWFFVAGVGFDKVTILVADEIHRLKVRLELLQECKELLFAENPNLRTLNVEISEIEEFLKNQVCAV